MNAFKGYVLIAVSGLAILALVLLALLQWGNQADLSLYGRNMSMNTGILMFFSAIGGVVLALMVRVLLAGLRFLRKAKAPPAAKPEA